MMFQNWNVLLHRLGEIPGVEPVTHPQADAALVEDARLKARLESHSVKHLLGAEGMTDAGDTRVIHLRKRFQVVHAARSVESRFTQTGPARSPLSKFLRLQFRISSLHNEAFRAERDVATADQFQGQGQLRPFSEADRLSKSFLGCLMEDDDCGSLFVLLKPFGKEQVCPDAVIALTDKTDQLPNVVGFNFTRLRLDVQGLWFGRRFSQSFEPGDTKKPPLFRPSLFRVDRLSICRLQQRLHANVRNW